MDGGKKVWVPDNEHGFHLGEIVDIGSDSITVQVDGPSGKVQKITESVNCSKMHNFLFSSCLLFSVTNRKKMQYFYRLLLLPTIVCFHRKRIIPEILRTIVSI